MSTGSMSCSAELNLRFFFLDAHGLTYARPRPPLGLHAPIFTRAGVAAFGRDLMSSKQVWSSTEGYPADGVYRDFYRDIGFDRPLSEIAPYIHPDGIRVHTGYKYHRVTGPRVDLQDKALYEPEVARLRAREHARDFVEKRQAQVAWLSQRLDRRPIIVSPYDAELFGHWWFEGPTFLGEVLRLCSQPGSRGAASDGIRLSERLSRSTPFVIRHPRRGAKAVTRRYGSITATTGFIVTSTTPKPSCTSWSESLWSKEDDAKPSAELVADLAGTRRRQDESYC
jgi:predicted glycosyl hydrolase (DUF1957 family)